MIKAPLRNFDPSADPSWDPSWLSPSIHPGQAPSKPGGKYLHLLPFISAQDDVLEMTQYVFQRLPNFMRFRINEEKL